ncbi:MAG: hypothetical protein WC945_08115 [Bacteroidales bacterium]
MKSLIIRYICPLILLLIALFNSNTLEAQFFSFGTDPGRAKWNYVESDNFKVIYPQEIDSLAKRYAWLLDNLREPVQKSLNVKTRKIDVILHPYSAMSNGMVGVAPRRVELITVPPANDHYVTSWEKHLITHELRHVGQVSKFERGIFKPLSWVIGEQSTAIGVGLFMSQWLLEGDAVVTETELSRAGRGRDPDHLIYYKAAFLDGHYRSWNQWTMGSYKHYVPSVYSFGYLYCSFVRSRANNYNYLGEVTDYVISHFYDLGAAGKGYKKHTGLTKRENFNAVKSFYTKKWREEDSIRGPFTTGVTLSKKESSSRKEDYRKYLYPVEYNGTVYSLKSDLDIINRLVSIDSTGKESFVKYMGRISSPLKESNGKIYWTEYIRSRRWELENFSDLFSYDIKSGITKRLTKGERYFNPSFTFLGDTLSVTSYDIKGTSSLVLLSASNMEKLDEIRAPEGYRVKESAFAATDAKEAPRSAIFVNATSNSGNAIFSLKGRKDSVTTSNLIYDWKLVLEPQQKIVSDLSFEKSSGKLWFISDLDGVKNLYNYNVNKEATTQVTNARFGISSYLLSKDGSTIVSDFSKSGYNLVKVREPSLVNRKSSFKTPYIDQIAANLSKEAGFLADTLMVPKESGYSSKKYRKGLNLFRVHSWAPLYYNIDNIKSLSYETIYDLVSPGFTLYSQNSLSSAYAMAGYSWHNGFHSGHFKFSYHGLYPVIEVKSDINDRDKEQTTLEMSLLDGLFQKKDTLTNSPYIKSQVSIYFPLSYSSGGWSRGIIPNILWHHTNDAFYSYKKGKFSNYQYLSLGVNLYSVLNMSKRDIFPRKGYGLSMRFSGVPFSGENYGTLLYSSVYLYTPGIIKGHGLRISASAQKQFVEGKNYLMSNAISFPSGYLDRYSEWAASINAQYALPLYTGDISLTSLLYIKRFKLIPFVSYCRNGSQAVNENLFSVGSELVMDLNLLGISYPLSLGVRGGYTAEKIAFLELIFQTPL